MSLLVDASVLTLDTRVPPATGRYPKTKRIGRNLSMLKKWQMLADFDDWKERGISVLPAIQLSLHRDGGSSLWFA